jgi:LysM repeat protein
VEQKPTPVEQKPAPVEQKPTPVEQKPTPVEQKPTPVEQKPPVVHHPRPRPRPRPRPHHPAPTKPTPTPVQQTPGQTPIQTGGGTPTSRVLLDNRDRNSSVRLTSDRGTMVEIFGDPHVRAMVNGVKRSFNIGYGPGSITLKDGTRITWDTWHNSSRALRNFAIDAPGDGRDNRVSTADGRDVRNQLTNLTDAQLREFISKLSEFSGDWAKPLRHRPGTGINTSPTQAAPHAPQQEPRARGQHVVKRGDTLWAIATKAGLTVDQVARFNKIKNPDLIYPGQVIKLPG